MTTITFKNLFKSAQNELEESEAALEALLERDPFCCYENLQTKGIQRGNVSFDDRCYLQFAT